jgi:uncharacterized membrane protein
MQTSTDQRPIIRAGVITGIGIGGFFDGIVLHQILQWHHMLTSAGYPPNTVENLQINTLADGLFHAVTWILTLIGIFLLWRALQGVKGKFPVGLLTSTMLIGWGLFNLVEGIVDHYILQIHHVRSGPDQAIWDLAFLIWGALMVAGGWWLLRGQSRKNNV